MYVSSLSTNTVWPNLGCSCNAAISVVIPYAFSHITRYTALQFIIAVTVLYFFTEKYKSQLLRLVSDTVAFCTSKCICTVIFYFRAFIKRTHLDKPLYFTVKKSWHNLSLNLRVILNSNRWLCLNEEF